MNALRSPLLFARSALAPARRFIAAAGLGRTHAAGSRIARGTERTAAGIILLAAALGGGAWAADDTAPPLDAFGGWSDLKGRATGWFHLESFNGRTLLVTPTGHGFVALGVNHLNAINAPGEGEPDLFTSRYGKDWDRYAEDVLRHYAAWGFNTVDEGVAPLRRARPYFAGRDFVRTAKYYRPPGEPGAWEFPDVFDPAVVARLEHEVGAFCREHRDNPNLIAYYWTDTPTWDVRKTRIFRRTDWVSEIRQLPPSAAGKRRYADFLRRRHGGDIARFNQAYGLHAGSFDVLPAADFSGVDLQRDAVADDDELFLGEIARQYYGIVGPAMRRHDPHHLIFGEKYLLGDIPPQVLAAALPYLDAVAVQPGDGYIPLYTPGDVFPRAELDGLQALAGKPVMICDHQVSFASERHPRAIWPYHMRANEADAAAATERFMLEAFGRPYIVGYMRCQYIDRFSVRRDAIKLGMLQADGMPHAELAAATRRATEAARREARAAARTISP